MILRETYLILRVCVYESIAVISLLKHMLDVRSDLLHGEGFAIFGLEAIRAVVFVHNSLRSSRKLPAPFAQPLRHLQIQLLICAIRLVSEEGLTT